MKNILLIVVCNINIMRVMNIKIVSFYPDSFFVLINTKKESG